MADDAEQIAEFIEAEVSKRGGDPTSIQVLSHDVQYDEDGPINIVQLEAPVDFIRMNIQFQPPHPIVVPVPESVEITPTDEPIGDHKFVEPTYAMPPEHGSTED